MAERRLEFLKDIAVYLRCGADDVEPHLLPEGTPYIAHHARKLGNSVAKRPHAARQRLIVKPMSEAGGLTIGQVHLDQPFRQELLTLENSALCVSHCRMRALIERLFRKRLPQIVDRSCGLVVQSFQLQKRFAKRLQPTRFHE